MTAPQDAETYIQIEVIILVLINFACKLRIRFATLFEKHLFHYYIICLPLKPVRKLYILYRGTSYQRKTGPLIFRLLRQQIGPCYTVGHGGGIFMSLQKLRILW